MDKFFSKLILGSFVTAAVIFNGCGGTADTQQNSSKQPHKVSRVLDYEADHADDWQNYVDIKASYETSTNNVILDITFNEGITSDVSHFQIYLNNDGKHHTGYNDGAIKGAEYLIEDGSLFKSTSDTEWEWEYVDEVYYVSEELDDGKHHIMIDDNGAAADVFKQFEQYKHHQIASISIEPVNDQWQDTHNFVKERTIYPLVYNKDNFNTVSPDGKIAYLYNYNSITIVDITEPEYINILNKIGTIGTRDIQLSKDGSNLYVAYTERKSWTPAYRCGGLKIFDVQNSENPERLYDIRTCSTTSYYTDAKSVKLSPDETKIFVLYYSQVLIYNQTTSSAPKRWKRIEKSIDNIEFSPDGSKAFLYKNEELIETVEL